MQKVEEEEMQEANEGRDAEGQRRKKYSAYQKFWKEMATRPKSTLK